MKASKLVLSLAAFLVIGTVGAALSQAVKTSQRDTPLPNQPAPFSPDTSASHKATQVQTTAMAVNTAQHQIKKGKTASDEMKNNLVSGMDSMQKMPVTGNTDKDFAMMMKMHHQQGVELAQLQLSKGNSPVMNTMAKNIISVKKKDIAQLDKWLAMQR